ncbi:5'-nucleotidase [Flavobacterium enshiense]|uniref:5'-nucleotidase C-terminal domain-containing protein n=1 Tax=Flavobacterium enshiense TaxID=1341165 RepID=UPI00345D32A9
MVNLRNNNRFSIQIIAPVLLFLLYSCASKPYHNYKIEGKQIPVSKEYGEVNSINSFVTPYRDHINSDLDNILAYSPETLDKSKGEWQTTIGNLMADLTVEIGNPVFNKRTGKNIDICLLNHGGIRAVLPKGNVTTRTAFEIMPFENSLIIVELKGTQIREMAEYILKEHKPHPLWGMKLIFNKDAMTVKSILINGKPLDNNTIYYVATSDYLSNGGDKMDFFKKAAKTHDMDYKLRNVIIDYFKKIDTIPVITEQRIIAE